MPKISLVVAVYNVENEIAKCMFSLINQSYNDYEIILVNDGSNDKSGEICDQYKEKDPRVKVIHKINGGAGSARNQGIDIASGEFIMFPDSDDWAEPHMLESVLWHIDNTNSDLVMFGNNAITISEHKNKTIKTEKWEYPYRVIEGKNNCIDAFCELLFSTSFQTPWNKLYKLDIIKNYNIRFPDLRRAQDAIFNMEYYKHVNRIAIIPDILYNFRLNSKKNIWRKFPTDLYKIDIFYHRFLVSLLSEWNKYNCTCRNKIDELYVNTLYKTFRFCRNPYWKMNVVERIDYIKNIISQEYNIYRINNLEIADPKVIKKVKLIQNKKYFRIFLQCYSVNLLSEENLAYKILRKIYRNMKAGIRKSA